MFDGMQRKKKTQELNQGPCLELSVLCHCVMATRQPPALTIHTFGTSGINYFRRNNAVRAVRTLLGVNHKITSHEKNCAERFLWLQTCVCLQ